MMAVDEMLTIITSNPEKNITVCTKFYGNQSIICGDISLIIKHTVLLVALNGNQWTTKVIRIHYLATMNVCTKLHGNPSNSGQDVSILTKAVDLITYLVISSATSVAWQKIVSVTSIASLQLPASVVPEPKHYLAVSKNIALFHISNSKSTSQFLQPETLSCF